VKKTPCWNWYECLLVLNRSTSRDIWNYISRDICSCDYPSFWRS